MSLLVEVRSCGSMDMVLEESMSKEALEKNAIMPWAPPPIGREGGAGKKSEEGEEAGTQGEGGNEEGRLSRQISRTSVVTTEEDVEEEGDEESNKLDLGPQVSLKQQLDKDKDDESLRRWKEQLLGCVDFDSVGENLEAEVRITSLSIISPNGPDIVLPIPVVSDPKGSWFTLKEGSHYRLKFSFVVSKNIVSGLRYTNKVWKAGIKVDSTKEMLGTFGPQLEPYVCELPEHRTPSGIFARGSYSARSRFVDDDGNCYLDINYTFEIRKEWQPRN